jgi:hypothetical protein
VQAVNYKALPKGYRYAATLDFMRNRKQMKAVVWLSLALIVVPTLVGLLFVPVRSSWRWMLGRWYRWPALLAALVLYIPLHELTHGAVMFALSGVKPSFGVKLPYAYAGSTAWFDRRSHVITALAPLIVWGAVLFILMITLPPRWFWPLLIVQISNLSGSAGDIYCAWVLMKMDGDLLIQDTGTRMRVMRYVEK